MVLLNAGASATNINILSGEQSVFTRDISIGGNAYTEALQRELNLTVEQADQLKRGHDLPEATYEDARPVLRAVTEHVILEIQKTFDFFKATAASDRIDRIYLSGGASQVDGFAAAVAAWSADGAPSLAGSQATALNGSNSSTGVPNRSSSISRKPSTRDAPPLRTMRSMWSDAAVALKKSNVF